MGGEEAFDYVVIGSGAGGGVVAARLAEAGRQVLLLEAGDDPAAPRHPPETGRPLDADFRVPAFHAFASENPGLRWDFWVRHYDSTARQRRDWRYRETWNGQPVDGVLYPRASGLGGCTGHNAMIVVRPNNADWNHIWQLTGDASWKASAMQKYFQRLERCRYRWFPWRWLDRLFGWNPTGHGWDGWLSTERALPLRAILDWPLRTSLWRAILAVGGLLPDAAEDWGWFVRTRGDPNDIRQVDAEVSALCVPPMATFRRARSGPRDLLRAVERRHPGRLTIRLNALVTRLELDPAGGRVTGVFYREGVRLYRAAPSSGEPGAGEPGAGEPGPGEPGPGEPGPERRVAARREVILAAGAFNTPQLLMLSGIGDRDQLARHGIAPRHHLPGVGRNLQDRYEISVVNRVRRPWQALKGTRYEASDRDYRRWRRWRTGPYVSNGALFSVMFRSPSSQERPDLFCFSLLADFRGYYPGYAERVKRRDCLTWVVLKAYTQNTAGTVELRSADPREPPAIAFRYLDEGNGAGEDDLEALAAGIRYGRAVADAIGHRIAEEELPGRHVQDAEQLKRHIADNAWGHHACGTCAMKPLAQGGVVDSRFRVHGLANLRIVDASVFPRIPGYFIVSSIYMIAEKAADVILAEPPG
jgi:choline dehydrogenase